MISAVVRLLPRPAPSPADDLCLRVEDSPLDHAIRVARALASDPTLLARLVPSAPVRVVPAAVRPGDVEVTPNAVRLSLVPSETGDIVHGQDEDGRMVLVAVSWPSDGARPDADRIRRGLVEVGPLRLDPGEVQIVRRMTDRFPPDRHDFTVARAPGQGLRVGPLPDTLRRALDVRRRVEAVAARLAVPVPQIGKNVPDRK